MVAVLLLPYLLTPLYRVIDPVSTLMLGAGWSASAWSAIVPLERIAPVLVAFGRSRPRTAGFAAITASIWTELQAALDDADDLAEARGGSTITQQIAKNLFLWPGRSFIRKGLEFPLALWIDLVLPKRRILEIYLNIAEWGPNGEFGVEAGCAPRLQQAGRATDARRGRAAGRDAAEPEAAQRQAPRPGVRRVAGIIQVAGGPLGPGSTAVCAPKGSSLGVGRSSISPASRGFDGPARCAPGFQGDFVMAVPKRKTSPSRRGMRRSADALKRPTYVEDKDSGELRRPHHIDLKTGMYKGRRCSRQKTEV